MALLNHVLGHESFESRDVQVSPSLGEHGVVRRR